MIFGRCPRRRRSEPSLGVFTRRDVHGRAELEVEFWHSGGGVGSTCVFFLYIWLFLSGFALEYRVGNRTAFFWACPNCWMDYLPRDGGGLE